MQKPLARVCSKQDKGPCPPCCRLGPSSPWLRGRVGPQLEASGPHRARPAGTSGPACRVHPIRLLVPPSP